MLEFDEKLLTALEPALVERSRLLHRGGAVVELRHGRLDDLVILAGRIEAGGEEVFRVHATIENQHLHGDCTCRRQTDCEHVGALLLAAVNGRQSVASPDVAPGSGLTSAQYMAYLLRLSNDGEDLNVCPIRVSPGSSGRGPATTPYALSRLSDSRQPDYVTDADLAILHALADRMALVTDLVWYPLGPSSHGLLRAMIECGRCQWESVDGPALVMAEPLQASAEWQLLPSGYQRLLLVAEDDVESVQLPLAPPWRVNTHSGRCRMLKTAVDDGLVSELLTAGALAPDKVRPVVERLAAAPAAFPRPRELALRHMGAVEPKPRLMLVNTEVGAGNRFATVPAARLSFAYGDVELTWDEEFSSRVVTGETDDDACVMMVQRDHAFEEGCCERLEMARLVSLQSGAGRDYRPGEGGLWVARQGVDVNEIWIAFQARLGQLRNAGWQVELADDLVLELVEPERWYGDFRAASGDDDSFELDLGVEWRGLRQSLLPSLLDWLERTPETMLRLLLSAEAPEGQVSLALDERRVVLMPMERLVATLRGLVDCLDATPKLTDGRLPLPRGRLAELAEAAGLWQFGGDEGLAELSQRLAEFERIEPVAAPVGLAANLRGYQSFGLAWLQFLREFGFGGILADDMGLGKTIQALAHVLAEKKAGRLDRPCLVVAPTSLMFNWRAEARRFTPDLKVLLLHGPKRKGLFQWIDDSDLVLTTYPLLPRDIDRLKHHEFHLLILDEAQAIKNVRAQVSRQVRELRARHRLCMSGTPLENHLGELWSLFDFLMPGFLGSQARFRRLFQLPIERHDDQERRQMLARRIRPFFLRRTKAEVAPELPPKTVITQAVALEGDQRRLYERVRVALHDKVRRALDTHGVERSRIVVLDALLKLRQICCDPRLLKGMDGPPVTASAKLSLLMDMLPELVEEGRRVLVFSQFVGMLNLIEAEVGKQDIAYTRLTGRTRNREKVVELFQGGRVPVFLISLKAGGVGLNLTAADTVIHYDPWWNPAVEDQATDRAHRIGQAENVFVYKLLTEDTIEQKVFELQQSKRGLVDGLLGGGGAVALSAEDLDALFEPLA